MKVRWIPLEAIGVMREAFKKIEGVVDDIGLGTLTFPLEEKVSNYVFIFYQIADVLQHLPAYLKKNHPGLLPEPDRRFRHQLATRGISVADNTEKLQYNLHTYYHNIATALSTTKGARRRSEPMKPW